MLLCAKIGEINNIICQCRNCKQTQTKSQSKKFGSGGSKAILEKTGGKCWYCGVKLTDNSRINDPNLSVKQKATMFTIDHYKPITEKGSRRGFTNLLPCCNKCNNLKGRGSQEWLRAQLIFIQNKWPRFNHTQYQFLLNHGTKLESFGEYIFYFEEYNLSVEDKNGE